MSAYIIFIREKTLDEQELAKYAKEAPATLVGHEVKALPSMAHMRISKDLSPKEQ